MGLLLLYTFIINDVLSLIYLLLSSFVLLCSSLLPPLFYSNSHVDGGSFLFVRCSLNCRRVHGDLAMLDGDRSSMLLESCLLHVDLDNSRIDLVHIQCCNFFQ